jgi:hypothetical protein
MQQDQIHQPQTDSPKKPEQEEHFQKLKKLSQQRSKEKKPLKWVS